MDIMFYKDGDDAAPWLAEISQCLPRARVREWLPGDQGRADYALVWKPPADMLRQREGLRAVFNLGAGVDGLLAMLRAEPALLPSQVPLIRIEDAGMAVQMVQYVSHAVLRHYRRMDDYARLKLRGAWAPLPPREPSTYVVGVMGLGALGVQVATSLAALGFPVRGWSRSARQVPGMRCFAEPEGLRAFAGGLQALVNLLPLTAATENILNQHLFAQLAPGATLINVARGAHLVEHDLIAALDSGQLESATLDVFREEPLPPEHPFWRDQRIEITPHIAAETTLFASIRQIAAKIRALENGEAVAGVVDLRRGY